MTWDHRDQESSRRLPKVLVTIVADSEPVLRDTQFIATSIKPYLNLGCLCIAYLTFTQVAITLLPRSMKLLHETPRRLPRSIS